MYGGKSWGRFRHLQPFSTKYNTASTSSRFSHLLRFPPRGNNGSIIAHWLSLKSLAYLRRSFFCIMRSLYYFFLIGTTSQLWTTMRERGVTQYQLLQNGIDNKTLDAIKKGKNITLLTLEKLCNIIDCTPNDIVCFSKQNSEDTKNSWALQEWGLTIFVLSLKFELGITVSRGTSSLHISLPWFFRCGGYCTGKINAY